MGNRLLQSIASLLFQLLWCIGGTPPVLRGTKSQGDKKRVKKDKSEGTMQLLLVFNILCFLMSPVKAENCKSDSIETMLENINEDIEDIDVIAVASVISRSRVHRGYYSATFTIKSILQNKQSEDLRTGYVRLNLVSRKQQTKSPGNKICSYPITKVKPNTQYLLFLRKDEASKKFEALGQPLKFKKKYLSQLKRLRIKNKSLSRVRRGRQNYDKSSENLSSTRLSCSARGNPPPTLYWTMNGKIIKQSQDAKIFNKKVSKYMIKSILKLQASVSNRSLKLQCHAYNQYGHTSKVKMTKPKKYKSPKRKMKMRGLRNHNGGLRPTGLIHQPNNRHQAKEHFPRSKLLNTFHKAVEQRRDNPLYSSQCPVTEFCLNGGTCQYYSTIGEQTCHCPKGYHGQRCERKYVNSGSQGARMSDRFPLCLLGMAHYPCSKNL